MKNSGIIYLTGILLIAGFVFVFSSCTDGDDPEPLLEAADGFYIVNEGAFGNSNATLSYYDRETNSVINNVFATANGRGLGDQAQSMSIFNGKGYVVVQNSAKIEVINVEDYTSIATIIDGVISPRYFQGYSTTKGYLSDWGDFGINGSVMVVDLSDNSITKTISTGQGANKMLIKGSSLYVANSGGWGRDSTVVVINTTTDEIVDEINAGQNPNSLQMDKDGSIWVASSGYVAYNLDWSVDMENSIPGSISKINSSNEVVLHLEVESVFNGPANLCINTSGDMLYFTYNGAVYNMSITATLLPSTALISKSFYGLSVDPYNDNILGMEVPDFSSNGNMIVYDEEGTQLATFTVGIGPNGASF